MTNSRDDFRIEETSSKPTVAFSCVVDRNAAIERAALIWVNCLLGMEHVDPAQIFVHTVEPDLAVLDRLGQYGVNIVPIERFGDGKHCNKLAQPLSAAEYDADILVMNDCDIAMSGSFLPAIQHQASLALGQTDRFALGKTVDFCNPPLEILTRLMALFDIGRPAPLAFDTLAMEAMPKGYFNGGVYGLPVPFLKEFGTVWQEWAMRLLNSEKAKECLGSYLWHVDQISFYFAMRELKAHAHMLDERFNFPIHVAYPARRLNSVQRPHAIHFHNNLGEDGLPGLSGIRAVDLATARVNACLETRGLKIEQGYETDKPFNAWHPLEKDFSMTTRNAAQLQTLLKAAGIETAAQVLDVRCATARHVEGLTLQNYRGFDTRAREISLAGSRGIKGEFVEAIPTGNDAAELVLCLDFRGFAQEIGHPDTAAELLGDLTENRLLVLAEPPADPLWEQDSTTHTDVAGALRSTGKFQDLLELGDFAGRRAILALSNRAAAGEAQVIGSDVERLYGWLSNPKSLGGHAPKPESAAEIQILSRLPQQLQGCRVGMLAGGRPHEVFEAVLGLRGAECSEMLPSPADAGAVTAEIPGAGGSATTVQTGVPNDGLFDYIALLPNFDANALDAELIGQISRSLKPGGVAHFGLPTGKRSGAVTRRDADEDLPVDEFVKLLGEHSLLATFVNQLPLPFDCPQDVVVVEAVNVGGAIVKKKKRKGTPEFLRKFERSVRVRIKGRKPGND